MNEGLYDSQKSERAVDLKVKEKKADIASQPETPVPESVFFKLIKIERQFKANVILNNICLILLLSLFSLIVVISTFINTKWFLIDEAGGYEYWTNFLFLEKDCNENNLNSQCIDSVKVYSQLMFTFHLSGCVDGNLTFGDPPELCDIMTSYYYAGLFAGVAVFFGILTHIAHLLHLSSLARKKNPHEIQGIDPLKLAYAIIFLYSGSFLYWIFASTIIIDNNTSLSLLKRFGSSFYCYILSVIFFMLLVLRLKKVYYKGVRRGLVTKLLEAEEKYDEIGANEIHETSPQLSD